MLKSKSSDFWPLILLAGYFILSFCMFTFVLWAYDKQLGLLKAIFAGIVSAVVSCMVAFVFLFICMLVYEAARSKFYPGGAAS